MSTPTPFKEGLHRINFFLRCTLVLYFARKWWAFKDVFRALWWKVWGHSPKDIEFHMSQISFGVDFHNRHVYLQCFFDFADAFYGKGNHGSSQAVIYFVRFLNFCYIPYGPYRDIQAILDQSRITYPGLMILDFIMKYDGITASTMKYRKDNPAFVEILDQIKASKILTEKEFDDMVAANKAAREKEQEAQGEQHDPR